MDEKKAKIIDILQEINSVNSNCNDCYGWTNNEYCSHCESKSNWVLSDSSAEYIVDRILEIVNPTRIDKNSNNSFILMSEDEYCAKELALFYNAPEEYKEYARKAVTEKRAEYTKLLRNFRDVVKLICKDNPMVTIPTWTNRNPIPAIQSAQPYNIDFPVKCPSCGSLDSIQDTNPGIILTTYPSKKSIHCTKCSYTGYRFV